MKIIFCGGHHNSALVLAEELRKNGNDIFWFGHKYSMIGDKNVTAEYKEVTQAGFPFIGIKAGKLQFQYKFIQNLLRIPIGFFQSFSELKKIKPRLIFSFGGYLALPVAYGGWILRIPVVTHEQTVVCGLSNKLISLIAKRIFVSFEESLQFFPKKKTIFSGMPVRNEIYIPKKLLFKNKKMTIYVTGGKQGSHKINEAVFNILPQLLEKFNLIHQCGSNTLFNDYQKALSLKESMGDGAKDYLVKDYFFTEEIGSVLHSSDFVISRAGAHTVYELIMLEKPAILIPISWSNQNEQMKNAQYFKKLGLGEILPEEDLEKGKLWENILSLDQNLKSFSLKKEFKIVKNPVSVIIEELRNLKLQ